MTKKQVNESMTVITFRLDELKRMSDDQLMTEVVRVTDQLLRATSVREAYDYLVRDSIIQALGHHGDITVASRLRHGNSMGLVTNIGGVR